MLGRPIGPAKEASYQAFSAPREVQGLSDLWLFFYWHGDSIGMKAHPTGKLLIQRLVAQQPVLVSAVSDANADAVPQVVFSVARHVDRVPPPLWSLVVVGFHSACPRVSQERAGVVQNSADLEWAPLTFGG